MDHTFKFFNYSQCYAHYTERITTIRQAKIRGEVIVAKPVLMLALIDGIEAGVFTDNRFTLNEWLEQRYLALMREYTKYSQFEKPAEENVRYACFDDDLWVLLQSKEWRTRLREYIVEHKLTDGRWFRRLTTEGLAALAAMLMVA